MGRVVKDSRDFRLSQATAQTLIVRSLASSADPINLVNIERAAFDLELRRQMWTQPTVMLPANLSGHQKEYWRWYASKRGVVVSDARWGIQVSDYVVTRPSLLFFSQGVESVYGRATLGNIPTRALFTPGERRVSNHLPGTLEMVGAIMGAARGAAVTFIGLEPDSTPPDLVEHHHKIGVSEREPNGDYRRAALVEMNDTWRDLWNDYAGTVEVRSVVTNLHRDELMYKLHEMGLLHEVRSCWQSTSVKPWCGKCWKCYLTWATLHATELDPTEGAPQIDMDPTALEQHIVEGEAFRYSGVDEYVSQGSIMRLVEVYGYDPRDHQTKYLQSRRDPKDT